jgi:hypothetical protein
MDSVPLRPLKISMSRDSDETTRLVDGHRQAHGRVSGNLEDDEDIGEEIDDFIKGMW